MKSINSYLKELILNLQKKGVNFEIFLILIFKNSFVTDVLIFKLNIFVRKVTN